MMKKWHIFVLMSIKIDLHAMKCIYCFSKGKRKRFGATKGESVNRRRTDNTMAKRKGTKGQTTIY
jgi:sulfatase maturation enzyme AslB (radical SAM superfamily)